MNRNTLAHLGLSPRQTTHITGPRRTRLINFLLRWQEYEAALACLEEMLAFNPGLVGLHDAQARALLGLDKPGAARDVMRARQQIRTSLNARRLEAQTCLAQGDVETALALASDMVSQRPESVTAWDLLGEIHLAVGDFDAALVAYRRLADLNPNSRTYLLGMLALHQARKDYVTASGYAVRVQRSADEGQSLPPTTLRRLRDYYRASGEITRAGDIDARLVALYDAQLAELQDLLVDDLKILARQPDHDRLPATVQSPPQDAGPQFPAVPLPTPDAIPVSDRDRQRLQDAVRELFGYQHLLPGQAETMTAALRHQDVLTVLPTGGGKSLCYQLPALLDEGGTTLVISPLIALMKDQVDSLPSAARRRATTINSSLDGDELRRRMHDMSAGRYRMVYAAPERLRQPPFIHALRQAGVNRLVIDEAHCVSVWGHDFRPDYLHIAQARRALGNPSLLAMTATAPPRVRHDILQRLADPQKDASLDPTAAATGMAIVSVDVHRPNLFLGAVRARNVDEKLRHLLALCQAETGSGIVYAGTRERCERIAALLRDHGISAAYYHAGIGDRAARSAAQDAFMSGQVRVMVATVAFGMGIDKADIRFIVHLQLPPSLEAYYQEAGRAGRDGQPARCVLIYSPSDRATLTRRAKRDALQIEFLRAVYTAVKRRLGDVTLGRVAPGDLVRDVRAEDTPVRVALSALEEAGLLRRHQDLPHTAIVRLLKPEPDATDDTLLDRDPAHLRAWSDFLSAAHLRPGQSLSLDPIAVAHTAGLDPTTFEAQLLAWGDARWLEYRPVGRDLLLEVLTAPPDATARVEALIDRHAAIQAQRVDEIAAYAATQQCRHGYISAYLSGRPLGECQFCDNCRPAASPVVAAHAAFQLPDEQQQLHTILRCMAGTRWGWGQANLSHILRGDPRASQRGLESSEWSALAFRSQAAVARLVDRLLNAELLRPRHLEHGGTVLELTPAGRAALKDPDRLAPLLPQPAPAPGVQEKPAPGQDAQAAIDEDLYQRLRVWRRETAQTIGHPPYVVAQDALLKRIAAARPRDEAALQEIKGMGPKRLERYPADILALVWGETKPDEFER